MLTLLTELALLFATCFAAATVLPLPSEGAVAALLILRPAHWLLILMVATVGNTLGSMTTYYLGRALANQWPSTDPRTARAVAMVQRYGAAALLLAWVPIVGDVLSAAAGWLRLPWAPVLIVLFLGKLARYAVIVWLTLKFV